MQLDKFTDYALRILVILAVRAPERMPTSAIAQIYGLSEHHLSKIGAELTRQGFVVSNRGRNGGLTLARAPDQINIGAVVRALKSGETMVECFGNHNTCIIQPACGLRGPLAEAKEAFFVALDQYSLTDVTRSKFDLERLLA